MTAAQSYRCLKPVLPDHALLIVDGAVVDCHFAEQAQMTQEALDAKAGVRARGASYMQSVNSWHRRFTRRLARFRGVASRYLIDYSGWRRALDDRRLTEPAHLLFAAVQLGQADGLPTYREHSLNNRSWR